MSFFVRVAVCAALCSAPAVAAAQSAVSGVVKDESGGVVQGATVLIRAASGVVQQTVTDSGGRFSLKPAQSTGGEFVVRAVGFAEAKQPLRDGTVDVVLTAAAITDSIKNRGSISLSYSDPRIVSASISGLFFGHQFDDDLNTDARPGSFVPGLPAYASIELMISRRLSRRADIFFGAQNLLDEEYYVGLRPTTIGTPRLVNGGIRVRFSGR